MIFSAKGFFNNTLSFFIISMLFNDCFRVNILSINLELSYSIINPTVSIIIDTQKNLINLITI